MAADETLSNLYDIQETHESIQEGGALIICAVFFIIYSISLCNLYHNKKNDNKYKMHLSITILPVLYVTIYLFRFTLETSTKMPYENGKIDDKVMLYIWTILDICFIISHSMFYLIMILRLKLSFQDSMYKLTKTKYYACIAILLLIIIIDILYYLVDRAKPGWSSLFNGNILHTLQKWNNLQVDTTLFIILVIFNIILGIIVIKEFWSNIFNLIKHFGNMEDIPTNQCQQRLLTAAIKYGLLCSIAIIVTNLQFSGWIILSYGALDKYPKVEIKFDIVQYWLFDVVLFVNFSCIWLSYPGIAWARKTYNCLCSYCHNCCKSKIQILLTRNNHDGEDGQSPLSPNIQIS